MNLGKELQAGWKKMLVMRWHTRREEETWLLVIWCFRMLTRSRKWRVMKSVWKCVGAFSSSSYACARAHTDTQPHTNFKYSLPFLFVQDVLAPWFPHLIVLFCAHFFYCSNYLISDYRRYRRWGFFCSSSRVSFYSRKAGRDSGFFSLGHILRYIGQKPASSSVFFFFLVSLSPTSYCVWCAQSLLSHLSITFQTNYVQMCCMFD